MKKISRKLRHILCTALAVILTVLSVPAVSADAATTAPVCTKSQTVYMQKSNGFVMLQVPTSYIYVKNLSSKAKITNLKSSNKKIVPMLRKNMNGKVVDPHMIMLELARNEEGVSKPKSGEKAKITFTVKQNGKSYNLYCNVTFKYAASPFGVLSIRTEKFAKNYAGAFKGYADRNTAKPKGSKMRVYIKPSEGHKVAEIIPVYSKPGNATKMKNGSWIPTKDLVGVQVLYTVTKKPANYQKPDTWLGKVPSPLHDYVTLWFR